MEITIDALSLGKPTVIKDKEFLSTKEYTDWFIKEMSQYTNRFITKVQVPNQMTLTKDSEDVTYNKVWIQAIMPNPIEGLLEVYGFVYALDVKTPVYKIYRAFLDPDTLNTVVFNQDWIECFNLESNEPINCSLENLRQKYINIKPKLSKLKGHYISEESENLHKLLGEFIDKVLVYDYKYIGGKVKLSTNNIINAYQKTFSDLTKGINDKMFYDAICNEINDNKDITNIFEKTILVGTLFDLVD